MDKSDSHHQNSALLDHARAAVRKRAWKYCNGEPTEQFVSSVSYACICLMDCIVGSISKGTSTDEAVAQCMEIMVGMKRALDNEAQFRMVQDFHVYGWELFQEVFCDPSRSDGFPPVPQETFDVLSKRFAETAIESE